MRVLPPPSLFSALEPEYASQWASEGSTRCVLSILQVEQDFSNDFGFGNEGNDAELASSVWTNERIGKVDTSDQMSPSFSQCGPLLWGDGGVDLFWGSTSVYGCG